MVSEMNTILGGQVVKSNEFDANKKIIGIAASNLIADAQGIVPLSKQGAFVQEERIDPELQAALDQGAVAAIEGQFVGTPIDSEDLDNPITMGDTSSLTSSAAPAFESPIDVTALVPETKEEKKVVVDEMELPKMEEVVSGDPSVINEDLFDMPAGLSSIGPSDGTDVVFGDEAPTQDGPVPEVAVEEAPIQDAPAPEVAVEEAPIVDVPEPVDMPLPMDDVAPGSFDEPTPLPIEEPSADAGLDDKLPDFELPTEEITPELPQDDTPFEEAQEEVVPAFPETVPVDEATTLDGDYDELIATEAASLKTELYSKIDIALDDYLNKMEALNKKKVELSSDGSVLKL